MHQWTTGDAPISIHALREEGDAASNGTERRMGNFYPRPPRGGRLCQRLMALGTSEFLSTPSARRATIEVKNKWDNDVISIHALREEGDKS